MKDIQFCEESQVVVNYKYCDVLKFANFSANLITNFLNILYKHYYNSLTIF